VCAESLSYTRRRFLTMSAAVGAGSMLPTDFSPAAEGSTIRPFRINVPEEAVVDLRRRLAATRPQFVTEIDGLDIQFAHVRARWPGSIIEQSPTTEQSEAVFVV
jgi:hypothetical protein